MSDRLDLRFHVIGQPVTQGSMRAVTHRHTGRAMLLPDSGARLGDWRQAIGWKAAEAVRGRYVESGPVEITATFHLDRPKSRPKREQLPDRRPDIDKLARALLDGLTGVAFKDDGQVVRLVLAKRYADNRHPPGVSVRVVELDPTRAPDGG